MSAIQGYIAHPWLKDNLRELSKTSLSLAILYAVLDQVIVLIVGATATASFSRIPLLLWTMAYLALATLAARQMRGMECLVHEASHYNWTRHHKLNDLLADWLASWPVMSSVHTYRRTHLEHHIKLGTEFDTDLARWNKLHLYDLDRKHRIQFIWGLTKRIIPYVPGWWWAIGVNTSVIIRFLLWHICFFAIFAFVVVFFASLSISFTIFSWILGWLLPLFIVLPVVRFIGEIEEHNYPLISIIKATNTNVGTVHTHLFHPHNDGYHTLHHLYPTIPFFRVAKVHKKLIAIDRDYTKKAPIRYSVLDEILKG